MMQSIRSWDLSGTQPIGRHKGERPNSVPLVVSDDPWGPDLGAIPSGSIVVDVWGCDRRVAIVERHYFRRSSWARAREMSGEYDPGRVLAGTPGEGITGSVQALAIERSEDGQVVEIGPLPDAVWLNGGALIDGTEAVTGMAGIRFRFAVSVADGVSNEVRPSWDLVMRIEAKPDGRLGCGDVVTEIVDGLSSVFPSQRLLLFGGIGGEE